MALTSFNDVYLSNEINRFFPMNGKVTVNATLELLANAYTRSPVVKRDVQKSLIQVIQVRGLLSGESNFKRKNIARCALKMIYINWAKVYVLQFYKARFHLLFVHAKK